MLLHHKNCASLAAWFFFIHASFHTAYKTTWLTAISSHCLATDPQPVGQPGNCPTRKFLKHFESANNFKLLGKTTSCSHSPHENISWLRPSLAALPAKDVCVQQLHAAKRLLSRVARSKWTKNTKPLVKKCQIASTNAKQAETGWMLLVLILPDE